MTTSQLSKNLGKCLLLSLVMLAAGCQLQETEFIQPVPVALAATNVTSTSFVASWNPVLGSSLYLVDVSSDPQFSNFVVGYQSREVAGTNLQIANLEAEQSYYYRVRARKGNTFSGNSNIISVSSSLLTAPIAGASTQNKVFQFTANWTLVDEAASYLLDVALDSTFTQPLPGYNGKEVVNTSLVIEGLDFKQTYYYRIRAKRLEKTSNYSNIEVVKPVISPACRLSKINFLEGFSVQFNYDEQRKLAGTTEDYFGKITTTEFVYAPNGRADEVIISSEDAYQKQKLVYNSAGLLVEIRVLNQDNSLHSVTQYVHNNQRQLIGLRKYSDAAKTELTSHEDYEIDARGNVLKVTDQQGETLATFRYDDRFNPKMLIPEELRQYIPDEYTRTNYCHFNRVNNYTYAQESYYYDGQVYQSKEVFLYDYNDKDITVGRNGYYNSTYEFTGCDF